VTSETIAEIFKELSRIREPLPSRDEMTMVKNYLAGLFPIQLETPQQVAGRVVAVELYGLPKTYYRNYRENIRKVTARDIKSVARKYVNPENMAIVLSGASKEIAGGLKKFGRVEISMPDGQAPTENKNREL
ncbi:MAG TPA: insulinase family protein, partial [Candidatus Kryptobacter bacterium]|nr:insulinase family protein [Candidatus Kryptobacter bacterium]